jgi:NADPH2:quinone reductase
MKAVQILSHGGPEVLQLNDVDLRRPAAGEVQIRHTAVGVNFSDINVRNGGFYVAHESAFPVILDNEAAGVIEAVGEGVSGYRKGDRVAYAGLGGLFFVDTAAYAEARNLPASALVKLPDDITDQQAAAMLLKGLTASVIINRTFRPGRDDSVLIHAAASGVGSLLAQWCSHLAAEVIGTVGTEQKSQFALRHGCRHTILYRQEDFVAAVKRLRPQGVSAVLDGVGRDTLLKSLDCVRPFGHVVNYGNASGPVPPFNIMLLAHKGCLALHRPGFGFFANTPQTRAAACHELFDLVRRGHLRITVDSTFPLQKASEAHRRVEAGQATGSVLLIP